MGVGVGLITDAEAAFVMVLAAVAALDDDCEALAAWLRLVDDVHPATSKETRNRTVIAAASL